MSALEILREPSAVLSCLVSYLFGALPFGLVLVRLVKGVDVRTVGSGNIGATNAMRAAGRPLGIAVFALDCFKGLAAVLILAPFLGSGSARSAQVLPVACGVASVVGHCFPVFLRFRGGKGVATCCGVLAALDPPVFLAGALVWLLALFVTRYTGLASILMAITFAVAAWLREVAERPEVPVGATLLALLILARHRSNISRMLGGTEPKVFGGRERSRTGRGP